MLEGESRPFWKRIGGRGKVLAGAALAFLAVKAAPFAIGAVLGHEAVDLVTQHNRSAEADNALANLADDPRFGGAYRVMAQEFPEDFVKMKAQLRQIALSATSLQDARERGMALTQQWVAQRRPYLASASDEAVSALIVDQEATLRHLQTTDVTNCASFGMDGKMQATVLPDQVLTDLAAHSFTDTLLAVKSGMERGNPGKAEVSGADMAALLAGVHDLHPAPGLEDVIISGKLVSAPVETQCAATLLITKATNRLAQPQRARVAKYLLLG